MSTNTQTPIVPKHEKIKNIILDEILSGLPPQVRNILQKFLREILAGIIIVVLAISLWFGYSAYTTKQENQAAAALGSAMQQPDPAKMISALEKVVHKHSNTKTGKHALLLLGAVQRDSGKVESAKKSFNRAKQEFSEDSFLYYSALMGLAYLQEDEAKLDEARRAYKTSSKTQLGFEAIAALDFARVSSASKHNDEALEAYNKYLFLKPQSSQLDFVHHQIMKLSSENKRPEENPALEKKKNPPLPD
ncbi:MAG: tetratricopeptide repeat protein [Deltaproteobacteria bacterium]|nr:tetratricopeptide repeat protein [Deltaproteobacteria bacterium]MDL1962159.1 tetratricopeptide repeat protein [Deltaproteobacteria bacterium]